MARQTVSSRVRMECCGLKVRAPQSGPRGTGFFGEALSRSARLSPRERTQSKQPRNIGPDDERHLYGCACRSLNQSVRAPARKRADPRWLSGSALNRPRTRYEPRVPPETDAKSTRVFDPNAARVLTRSLSCHASQLLSWISWARRPALSHHSPDTEVPPVQWLLHPGDGQALHHFDPIAREDHEMRMFAE